MPRIWTNHRGKITFAVTLAAGMAAGWAALPAALYERIPQPLDFDHQKHTRDAGLACADCHDLATGRGRGLPSTAKCEECHAQQVGSTAAERTLVESYVVPKREIPWLVYAR